MTLTLAPSDSEIQAFNIWMFIHSVHEFQTTIDFQKRMPKININIELLTVCISCVYASVWNVEPTLLTELTMSFELRLENTVQSRSRGIE